jgi:hypothetical protein
MAGVELFRPQPRLEIPDNQPKVPQLDFTPLNQIGNTIVEGQRRTAISEVVKSNTNPDGSLNYDRIGAGLSKIPGALEEARPFLALAMQKEAAGRAAAGQAETVRHNQATEALAARAYDEGKIPPGFTRDQIGGYTAIPGGPADPAYSGRTAEARAAEKVPLGFKPNDTGGYTPVQGGPADPDYIAQTAESKQKPRQFNVSDVTKLTEEGQKFGALTRVGEGFKDEYAGYGMAKVGDLANTAGRYLPEGVVGKDIAAGASWWQGYDRFKNVTRHELYGAALTPTEQRVFEQADINPGMRPEQIRKNLKVQTDVVQNGLKRKANSLIEAGYDPAPIAAAYGVDLKDLGVTATKGDRTKPAPKITNRDDANALIGEARDAIARGAPRDAVIKRLQERGVSPAGL